MILASMSFEEVRAKVLGEMAEMQLRTRALFPEIKKQVIQSKAKRAVVCREIYSAARNHYFVFYNYKSPVDCSIAVLIHLNDENGFRIISPMLMSNELSIQILTGHFYKRYNERNKLGLVKPIDMIKHFHRHNWHYTNEYSDTTDADGAYSVFSIIDSGAMLGYHFRELLVTVYKTFVDNSILFDEQKKRRTELLSMQTVRDDFFIDDTLELKLKVRQALKPKTDSKS